MLFGENDKYAIEAVSDLIARQSLSESVEEFLPGYKREIVEMLKRRLRLLGTLEATSIAQSHALGRLKMILEAKRDDRKKGRLILQGFREPKEWDEGSVASPVAYPSSLRTLLFHAGPRSDVISLNDVSVAFLQSNPYPKDQAPRYVEYQPYAHSHKWLFELMGSIYGQRSASREWFKTISSWLISEGFVGDDSDQVCNHVTSAQSHKRSPIFSSTHHLPLFSTWILKGLSGFLLSEFLVTVFTSCNKKYILSRESVFNEELNPIFKFNILYLVLVIQNPPIESYLGILG